MRQVVYGGSVHGKPEIDAVIEVLGSSHAHGARVDEFQKRVAPLLGKKYGMMVNSGSSALKVAVELLPMPAGAEVITPVLTFSTTVGAIVTSGMTPVFVDCEPETYLADLDAVEAMIGRRTKAVLIPNLIGNVPDWDRIREIADRRGLWVIEDSADTLGATLLGTPTGERSDISITSFYMWHVINCAGNGGMVGVNDPDWYDRALLMRSWGRNSAIQQYGSLRETDNGRFEGRVDGIEYDSMFVFDTIGYNFEPSEIGAAFGLAQLDRLESFMADRRRIFDGYNAFFDEHADLFIRPRQSSDVETSWLCYPLLIRPDKFPISRKAFQIYLEERGVATRMIFSGNILRQPGFRDIECRRDLNGYPNADRVMECGVMLPLHQGMSNEDLEYVKQVILECIDRK